MFAFPPRFISVAVFFQSIDGDAAALLQKVAEYGFYFFCLGFFLRSSAVGAEETLAQGHGVPRALPPVTSPDPFSLLEAQPTQL